MISLSQIGAILALLAAFNVPIDTVKDVEAILMAPYNNVPVEVTVPTLPIKTVDRAPILEPKCSLKYELTEIVNGNNTSGILSWTYSDVVGRGKIERAKIYGGTKGTYVSEWSGGGYITFVPDSYLTYKLDKGSSTSTATHGDFRLVFEDGTECFAIFNK